MLELIKFHVGTQKYYAGLILISPWLAAMKFHILSRQKAKEKVLQHFFSGLPVETFRTICLNFNRHKLPGLIRPAALQRIQNYKDENVEVVVVTASASDWVKPWCETHELSLIASELEVSEGLITGKLKGANCNYTEKVHRIKALYSLQDYSEIHCYGDSAGDQAMLSLATHPFFREL